MRVLPNKQTIERMSTLITILYFQSYEKTIFDCFFEQRWRGRWLSRFLTWSRIESVFSKLFQFPPTSLSQFLNSIFVNNSTSLSQFFFLSLPFCILHYFSLSLSLYLCIILQLSLNSILTLFFSLSFCIFLSLSLSLSLSVINILYALQILSIFVCSSL